MVQSSNYKQYSRATRVLTEESGFAGGMLWTDNNIDNTHLKTIVNCDYDDTTSYLKARDPFIIKESISNAVLKNEHGETVTIDLTDYTLLGAYNICPFNSDKDNLNASWLYVFFTHINLEQVGIRTLGFYNENVVSILQYGGNYYLCKNDIGSSALRCTTLNTMLLSHENYLYGVGLSKPDINNWMCVYRVEYSTPPEEGVAGYDYTLLRQKPPELEFVSGNCFKKYKGTSEYEVVVSYEDWDRVHYDYFVRTPKEFYSFTFKRIDYDTEIKPKIDSVTLSEAIVTGYNAARGTETFKYIGTQLSAGASSYVEGVYFTDSDSNVLVSPRIGTPCKLNILIARANVDTKMNLAIFLLKENVDTTSENMWQHVQTLESDVTGFTTDFTFTKKETVLAFALYDGVAVPTNPTAYGENVTDLFVHTVVANNNDANLKLKTYAMHTTSGRCIWKNRMCLWGLYKNSNSLLLSEVDNFYYYPVPNNVAVFDTNIISCIPYKDTLLVFTADKIYRMSENNDGTFTQSVIQNDMPLTEADAAQLTAIKNMVLFKSGNYFYMIVPKSQSLTDELSIAPIYKNIAGFLNNLDRSVQDVLQLLYPEYSIIQCQTQSPLITQVDYTNTPASIYAEQDTVHILYNVYATLVTNTADGVSRNELHMFKLFLNYNTNLRAWTLYLEDTTDTSLEVAALTSERKMSFVRINKNGSFNIVTQQSAIKEDSVTPFRVLIDTGYRTLSSTLQKRFREVQLKLHSASESNTAFGTAFLVDGVWRRNYVKLQETETGPSLVNLVPALDLNTFVTELSMPVDEQGNIVKNPGSDAIELSDWTLDFSHFKREAPITIRVPVSGKGYNPRFIFMAPDATGLTINEINWVYRLMHGR